MVDYGTFITEFESKLSALNYIADNIAKCDFTEKILNYDFVLGREILNKQGLIFNVENVNIAWQQTSISMK